MKRIEQLLHQAWGQAKESPEYDKKVFNELQREIERMLYSGHTEQFVGDLEIEISRFKKTKWK